MSKKVLIKDVCNVVTGSTPKSNVPEYWNGNIKWITPAEINEDSFIVNDTVRHITEEGVRSTGLKSFPKGTVILSSRAPIGKVAIAGCEMYCNQGFKNIICGIQIYNEYLYWFLKSKSEYLNSLGRGATFKEISKNIVDNIEVPLPNFEVQIHLADTFNKIKDLENLYRGQLVLLDQLVKSRFMELFIQNNAMFPKKKLRECTIINPKKSMDTRLRDDLIVSFVPMASVGEDGSINTSDTKKYCEVKSGFTYFIDGDVLFAKITPCMENGKGAVATNLYNGIGFGSTEFHVVRPIEGITNPVWLYTLSVLKEFRLAAEANMTGSAGQKRTPASFLQNYEIKLPPIDLQNQFAHFVEQVNKSKLEVQKSLEELETLKESLMQQYFG